MNQFLVFFFSVYCVFSRVFNVAFLLCVLGVCLRRRGARVRSVSRVPRAQPARFVFAAAGSTWRLSCLSLRKCSVAGFEFGISLSLLVARRCRLRGAFRMDGGSGDSSGSSDSLRVSDLRSVPRTLCEFFTFYCL